MRKPNVCVYVTKELDGYCVTQFNYDEHGNTIFHKYHGTGLTYREAHDLKKKVLADWKG